MIFIKCFDQGEAPTIEIAEEVFNNFILIKIDMIFQKLESKT